MTLLNYYSYPIAAAILLAGFIAFLWQRNLIPQLRVLYALGAAVVLAAPLVLFARQPTPVSDMGQLRSMLVDGRPTVVEYYSPYCLACITIRPLSEIVTGGLGTDVQVIQLDATDPVTGALGRDLGMTVTPSYALFDGDSLDPAWRLPGRLDREALTEQLRRLVEDG